MLQAGFVHDEGPYLGRPNVRRFAKAMCEQDGVSDREVMERNIRRWIDEENPTSPSQHMREVAAGVFRQSGLEVEPDELRLRPAVEELLSRRQETDDALAELVLEVAGLHRQVQALQVQYEALRLQLAAPEPPPEADES